MNALQMTTRVLAWSVTAVLCMTTMIATAEARIEADQVPHGEWRARAVSINGEAPAADQAFTFRFNGGEPAAVQGDAWSEWTPFGDAEAEAATGPHAYPNTYLPSWPLVVKMAITGVVDSTRVEVEWRFDEADAGDAEPRRMHGELYGGTLGFLIWPEDDGEAGTPNIATMAEYNQRYWAALGEIDIPEAHRPKQIPIVDRFIGGDDDHLAWQEGIAELSKAGFNGIMLPPDARIRDMLLEVGERHTAWAIYEPPGYAFDHAEDVTPDSIRAWAQNLAQPFIEAGYDVTDMRMYAMSDEPGWYYPGQFNSVNENPEALQRFRDYLAEQGLTPADVGHETWDDVHPLGRAETVDLPSKRLFYWTMRFFPWDSSRHFANSTRAMEEAFYPMMPVFTNWNFFAGRLYVPGPVANNSEKEDPNAAMGGHDWLEFGRMRGGTMMWTEDWFGDHQAYQWSFYAAKLRTASEKGDVVFGGYVIPRVAGQREDGIVQKIMTIVGHGGKGLKYFVFGPEYNFPTNTYSENIDVLPKMAEAHAMIGRAEDLLWPGEMPAREVAILHPRSAQMWDAQDIELPTVVYDATNTNLNARTVDYMAEVFNIYTALQHANIPADFVEEQDLNPDYLSRYRVLYVTEPNIPVEYAQGLAEWVNQGGHVVMVTGAGTFDRYDEPTAALGEAIGIVEAPRERVLIPDVNGLEVVGEVHLPETAEHAADVREVHGARAEAQAEGAEVLATFADESPAVFRTRVGEGQVTFFNFLPGIAYVRTATEQTNGLPTGWSPALRAMIVQPTLVEGVVPPVTLSEALIEAPVLVSDAGMAVTLLNWTGEDQASVDLHIRTPFAVASVESLDHGDLSDAFERVDGGVTVTLPVDAVDVLLLRP